MISYPGEILRRFGRYEAVEDLGVSAFVHLWGAWDPYLERFIIIAALDDVDPAQLVEGLRAVDAALERWSGGKLGGDDLILDFSPGDDDQPPFLVIATTDDDEDDGDAADALDQPPWFGAAVTKPRERGAAAAWTRTAPTLTSVSTQTIVRRSSPSLAITPLLLGVAGALLLAIGAASGIVIRSLYAAGNRERGIALPAALRTFTPAAAPTLRWSPPPRDSTPTPTTAATASVPTMRAPVVAVPVDVTKQPTQTVAPGATTATGTVTEIAIGTPTSPLDGWRAGRLQIDIAAPREPVAPGEIVKLRAMLSGLSAADLSRLECEWQVGGTPVSRTCNELELRAEPQPGGEPLIVGLSAQGQMKQVVIAMHTAAPNPSAAATAAPSAQRSRLGPRTPLPTINVSVSAGEAGVRGAVATYVRDQQRILAERTGKDVRCVLRQQSIRQARDGWEATATYTIDIPGQPIILTNEALYIVNRAGAWRAEKP